MNIKKTIFLRGFIGIPIGITIGYLITIIISVIFAGGYYSPCVPELEETMGSQIGAVVLQTVLCAILGAVFGAASVIWELDEWSIVKQTGIYFLIISVTMLPIAYFTHWMEHSVKGFLLYFGIFLGIGIAIWITQYFLWRSRVKKIQEKVSQ